MNLVVAELDLAFSFPKHVILLKHLLEAYDDTISSLKQVNNVLGRFVACHISISLPNNDTIGLRGSQPERCYP